MDEQPTDVGPGFRAYADNVRLTNSGIYTIHVREANVNETFHYSLCMVKIPGPNLSDPGDGVEMIAPGEVRQATNTLGDLDAFAFHAIAGDSVVLTIQKLAGPGEICVLLYGPDRAVLSNTSATSLVRFHLACLTNTGTFTIFIREDNIDEAFDYQLSLVQWPVVPPSSGTNQYLAAYQCTTNKVIRWSMNATAEGFHLQCIEGLPADTPPASWIWTDIPGPYNEFSGYHYYPTNGVIADKLFFRLIKP